MHILLNLIDFVIQTYIFIIILHIAVSWLLAFGVLNADNPQAKNLVKLLGKLVDPVMKPVQKYIPPIAGIDLSPVVVIIGLQILNQLLWRLVY